jgi:hypothetical protein
MTVTVKGQSDQPSHHNQFSMKQNGAKKPNFGRKINYFLILKLLRLSAIFITITNKAGSLLNPCYDLTAKNARSNEEMDD